MYRMDSILRSEQTNSSADAIGRRVPLIRNAHLYKAVRAVYEKLISGFEASREDVNSLAFLEQFPLVLVRHESGLNSIPRQDLIDGAFGSEFQTRTKEALAIFYANTSGGITEDPFFDLIDDFLNFVIPRTAGLTNGLADFDKYYEELDEALYGTEFTVTMFAVLQNISDHHGFLHSVAGSQLQWWISYPGQVVIDNKYLRDRTIPFIEFKKGAHTVGSGRELTNENAFFVLSHTEKHQKKPGALSEVQFGLREIVRKFVFASRLLTYAPVYSDYFGVRLPGCQSAFNSVIFNDPDEVIASRESRDIDSAIGEWFKRLLPALYDIPLDRIEVIGHKIEDALRRSRRAFFREGEAQKKQEIDQLLDYFQALESVIPIEGSYQISLYAALLATASGHGGLGMSSSDWFVFVRDMYKLRNAVVHGRLNDVLAGKVKTQKYKMDIPRLRNLIYVLAILHVLNSDLLDIAHRLALGEGLHLNTIYHA
jgi:hypothetical protein